METNSSSNSNSRTIPASDNVQLIEVRPLGLMIDRDTPRFERIRRVLEHIHGKKYDFNTLRSILSEGCFYVVDSNAWIREIRAKIKEMREFYIDGTRLHEPDINVYPVCFILKYSEYPKHWEEEQKRKYKVEDVLRTRKYPPID